MPFLKTTDMEKRFLITFTSLVLIAILFGCKKDEPITPDITPNNLPEGHAHSLYNGILWEYDAYSWEHLNFPGRFNLTFNHYNEYGERSGSLSMNNITFNTGNYFLTEWIYANGNIDTTKQFCDFFTLFDGDALGDRYIPLNDSAMVLTVDAIELPNQISGRFWGTMVKQIGEMEYDPASPDTLVFSEGTYEVKLE